MEQKQKQDPSSDSSEPTTLVHRMREALRAGLRAVILEETKRIDLFFESGTNVLRHTYRDFQPHEIPADIRTVLRDLLVSRDQYVEQMVFKVTEDFRAAIELVEWAIANRPEPTVPPKDNGATTSAKHPSALPEQDRTRVLRHILEHGPITTNAIHQALHLDPKQRGRVKEFLRWARTTGLVSSTGNRSAMTNAPTAALAEYLTRFAS
jgi:hypothetical protein